MVSATASRPDAVEVEAAGSPRRLARAVARFRGHRLSLRARITLAFAFGALVLSSLLAGLTFGLTRSTLLRQREANVLRQAYQNALVLSDKLTPANAPVQDQLSALQTPTGARPIVFFRGQWTAVDPSFGEAQLPVALRARVISERTPARMRTEVRDDPFLAVGLPLPGDIDGYYFEIVSLQETASTLRSIGVSLLGASVLTTTLGVLLGVWVSRLAMRPLADAASAATAIAAGRLDTRLKTPDDKDLGRLAEAFNGMAATLEARVDRDARFTSDVSHELRSPLMTLSASTEVLESNRDEMPERAAAALDLLVADMKRFQGLVEDLLEMSRYDAGGIGLHAEEVLAVEFVRQAVAVSGHRHVPVRVAPDAEGRVVRVDKLRLARVVQNLLDNAVIHGGGDVEVMVDTVYDGDGTEHVRMAVEDHGPGVLLDERGRVFERFARGTGVGRRGLGEGAGLGLALVAESVALHGGRVRVEDRLDGAAGARFVVELPVAPL